MTFSRETQKSVSRRARPPRRRARPICAGPSRLPARKEENDTITPLAKIRALERKAASGDVQAARELREHADWYYGSAQGTPGRSY
jgi:hypothetical protein